ncbi:MAG: hypothetical protein EBU97_01805, partial [Rhodobacteraceae bacterium]|nr:hypothetical protein [Paracoccaceae bacterium]
MRTRMASPPATASAPPGQKSFCTSMTIRQFVKACIRGPQKMHHALGKKAQGPRQSTSSHAPEDFCHPLIFIARGCTPSAIMLIVAALYHFARFDDPAALRAPLLALCQDRGIKGSLLLAREGVNGTIAGDRAGIDAVLAHLRALPGCEELEWKESPAPRMPFGRMKVRLKSEIVTMGQPNVDPRAKVGHYVSPAEWNDLISAPDVAVIDTRRWTLDRRIAVEDHPNEMLLSPDGGRLFVANANRNSVSVIDLEAGDVEETLVATLTVDAPPGNTPNSLAISADGERLFVSNANINAVSVWDVAERGRARSLGFIPVGWYPTAVRLAADGERMLVANGKGVISDSNRNGPRPGYDPDAPTPDYIGGLFEGTVSFIDLPDE